MFYHIKSYIITEKNYPLSNQIGNEIEINHWLQVPNTFPNINILISNYFLTFPKLNNYEACFIFFKYETNKEKNILEKTFGNKIININQFNIVYNVYTNINNILVVDLN